MRPALNCCSMRHMRVRSAVLAAIAGILAGGVALGVAELVAGLVPGAPSPVTEIGALLIAFQPRGAQQLVVSILGTADKPVLIIAVAIGEPHRSRCRRLRSRRRRHYRWEPGWTLPASRPWSSRTRTSTASIHSSSRQG